MEDSISDRPDENIPLSMSGDLISLIYDLRNEDPAIKTRAQSTLESLISTDTSLKKIIETEIQEIHQESLDYKRRTRGLQSKYQEIQDQISDQEALILKIAEKYGVSNFSASQDEILEKIYEAIEEKKTDRSNKKIRIRSQVQALEQERLDLKKRAQKIERLNTQREEIKNKIIVDQDNLQNHYISSFRPFKYVDKPISRVLIYCNDFAANFLYEAVLLHAGSPPSTGLPSQKLVLPPWFVEHYQRWWDRKKEDTHKIISNRTPSGRINPYLFLDYSKATLKLIIPEQTFSGESDASECYLCVQSDSKILLEEWVPLYDDKNGYITEKCAIPLESPSTHYSIEASVAHDIRTYNIEGIHDERPYLLFDYNTGRMLHGNTEITNTFYILLHESQNIQPDEAVIESSKLYGGWHRYRLHVVDPEKYGRLRIEGGEKDHHDQATHTEGLDIHFATENRDHLLRVNELTTFVNCVPQIRLLYDNTKTLLRSQLSLHPLYEGTLERAKFIDLSENESILTLDKEHKICTIDLSSDALLGPDPIGSFLVRIRNKDCKVSASYAFSLLKDLTYSLSETIHLPDSGDTETVMIQCPRDLQVEVKTDGILKSESWGYKWEGAPVSHITGTLTSHQIRDRHLSASFSLSIPHLAWRFETDKRGVLSQTCLDSREISDIDFSSLGRALSLNVSLPDTYEGNGFLFIKPGDQCVSAPISDGQGEFSLSRFNDTLSATIDPTIGFFFSFHSENISIDEVRLFSLVRWKILDFSYHIEENEADKKILALSWHENDDVRNRSIILWRMGKNESRAQKIDTIAIPDGQYSQNIVKNQKELRAGIYFVQFIRRRDEWETPRIEFTGENVQNVFQISIELESSTLLEDGDGYMASQKYLEAIECYKELQYYNPALGDVWKQKIMNYLIYPKEYFEAFTLFSLLLNKPDEMSQTDYSFITFRIFINILRSENHLTYEVWSTAIDLLKCLVDCGPDTVQSIIQAKSKDALNVLHDSQELSEQEKQSLQIKFGQVIEHCRRR